MNHVIRHIEYLVHRHDCVVLPKWGAFIADYQPACYDEKLGLMYPPVRELSFSASVDYNDGLLASSIARKEAVPFVQASRIVEEELNSMKHQLNLDGEISLGKVGRFIRQDEVSVIFEPAAKQSAIGSMGFDTLSIKPLLNKVKEDAISSGRIEVPRRGRLSRLGLRAVKAAAAIAVVIGISAVLLRPSLFNRHDDYMASIAPVMSQKSTQTSMLPAVNEPKTLNILVPVDNAERNEANIIASADDEKSGDVASTDIVVAVSDDAAPSVRMNASDRYCLVIASLPTQELAGKFIKENGSMNLGVLSKDGKYRVYAATGNTINEALKGKELADVEARFADAWVCSMR
ncbi:MAG: hypothetical protein K2L73_01480 [Muribaculaceae bacterium]|nr:hypothetical protein [Muribaculaceae bacterium]